MAGIALLDAAARPVEETAAAVVAIAVRVRLTGLRRRRMENRPKGELKDELLLCGLFQLLPLLLLAVA